MKVAVTGAGGLIGSHLVRHLARADEVLALEHRDLDITDHRAVERCLLDSRPSLVVNCASVEVDDCERDPVLAKAVHVEGPKSLAEVARRIGAKFVHFSTNYVFDGREIGRAPYTIQDEPRPINVYGRVKAEGERAAIGECSQTYIIRTSWVYGAGKKNFLSAAHRDLLAGKKIRAVSDMWACATYVTDLVAGIVEIVARGRSGTYHIVNEGVCSYYEFALEAGRLGGLGEARLGELIEVIKGEEARRPALRPRYTPMRCLLSEEIGLRPMRHWRSALDHYVKTQDAAVSCAPASPRH